MLLREVTRLRAKCNAVMCNGSARPWMVWPLKKWSLPNFGKAPERLDCWQITQTPAISFCVRSVLSLQQRRNAHKCNPKPRCGLVFYLLYSDPPSDHLCVSEYSLRVVPFYTSCIYCWNFTQKLSYTRKITASKKQFLLWMWQICISVH